MAFFHFVIARNNLPKKISHQKVPKSLLTYGKVCTFPDLHKMPMLLNLL